MQSKAIRADGKIIQVPSEVSAFIRRSGQFPLSNFRERLAFAQRNSGQFNTIVAFYNDGKSLFYDHLFRELYYLTTEPWAWVPYRSFATPARIIVSNKRLAETSFITAVFLHLSHNLSSIAKIKIGFVKDRADIRTVPQKVVAIPPFCISYIALQLGRYVESMLIYQPLPKTLLSKKIALTAYKL